MPESLNENKGLTPEMLKGVESIFDAASSPTEEQVGYLEELNKASVNQHKGDNAIVSGGIANIVAAQNQMPPKTRPIVRDHKKIGRNEPCPCGSGKKYKNCCFPSGKYATPTARSSLLKKSVL